MNTLLASVAGVLMMGGLVLGVWAGTPQPERPPRPRRPTVLGRWRRVPRARRLASLVAGMVGVLIALTTGWVVALVVLPAAVLWLPAVLMVSDEARVIARLDAIAEWTRNLAGVLTAGQGIEGALQASLRSTPEAIRPEVGRLVARLRARWSTPAALRAFADDLDDATGDLVCSALILGVARRGDGLARILTGLAESVSDDVRGRREVESDRAKPRASARTVMVIALGALGVLALSGQFLAPYGTPMGQAALAVLLAAFVGALIWLRRMSLLPPAPRFLGTSAGKARA